MPPASPLLDLLFHPRAIAVVGASTDPRKFGGLPVHYSKLRGYKGKIYPINPTAPVVQDLPAFPTICAVGQPVDVAIISVPAAQVPAAIEDAAAARVPLAVVFSSGFAEMGAEGSKAQERLVAIARAGNVRLIGPNCMGAFSIPDGFIATFTNSFEHYGSNGWPMTGSLSIASQSGAVGIDLMVRLRDRGLGLSKWVTTGNQCDIEIADCLDYLVHDPETRTICCYIEGVRDGRKLIRALADARAMKKPIVMLKVGATEAGARAVASHTASLAGSDEAFDAVLRQYGAHRAASLTEFVDVAAACHQGLFPKDRSAGFVSISGGVAAMMADAASARGLDIAPLPESGQAKLRALVPFAATQNPIDTAAPGMQDMTLLPRFIEVALADGDYASLVAFITHLGHVPRNFNILYPKLAEIRRRFPDRVIALAMMGPNEVRNRAQEDGFLVSDDPVRAVGCIAALADMAAAFHEFDATSLAPELPAGAAGPTAATKGESASRALLSAAGIPFAPSRLATSGPQAAAAARDFARPVALKIASPDLAHKTEIGGVALDVNGPEDAERHFATIIARARAAAPAAAIEGVLVSPMIKGGIETILGVKNDPVFGPFVLFGIGGIFVEIYRDAAMHLAPFGADLAETLIRRVKGFALLDGARGRPRADIAALADALARLSAYASAHADAIESIDINPFVVLPEGEGAFALDALIVPKT